jgi:hypothetical protein
MYADRTKHIWERHAARRLRSLRHRTYIWKNASHLEELHSSNQNFFSATDVCTEFLRVREARFSPGGHYCSSINHRLVAIKGNLKVSTAPPLTHVLAPCKASGAYASDTQFILSNTQCSWEMPQTNSQCIGKFTNSNLSPQKCRKIY